MSIILHSGSDEIGAVCIEIASRATRLLVDFGFPLQFEREKLEEINSMTINELKGNNTVPIINGIYRGEKPQFHALILSHAHLDHFGFLSIINNEIPVYSSRATIELIKINALFRNQNVEAINFIEIEKGKDFLIGDITVTPYSADHSVAGAFSFLFQLNGKNVFYTGDFRAHGRTAYRYSNLLNNPPKNINYLIMEGTNIDNESNQMSEYEVENEIKKEISEFNGLCLAYFSSFNIDRFISFYKACLSTKRILVIDPYTAYILDKLSFISNNLPQFNWNNIKIYFANQHPYTKAMAKNNLLNKYRSAKISLKEEISKNPSKYILKMHSALKSVLKNEINTNIKIIYSLWRGYYNKEDDFIKQHEQKTAFIHTSGHADIEQLKKFVDILNPRNIVPIHTNNRNGFDSIFPTNIIYEKKIEF